MKTLRYIGVLALVAALSYAYVERRDLPGRYEKEREREETIRAVRAEVEAMRKAVQESERKVRDLNQDPVEMEAAIRRIKGLVRPGEKVYRIEAAPPADASPRQ